MGGWVGGGQPWHLTGSYCGHAGASRWHVGGSHAGGAVPTAAADLVRLELQQLLHVRLEDFVECLALVVGCDAFTDELVHHLELLLTDDLDRASDIIVPLQILPCDVVSAVLPGLVGSWHLRGTRYRLSVVALGRDGGG